MTSQELEFALEALVDKTSLREVVAALSQICFEKAQHVEANWQDRGLARQWTSAGKSIDKCSIQSAVHSL